MKHFNGKAVPPKCELGVKWIGSKNTFVRFNFQGAKPPRDFCLVKFSQGWLAIINLFGCDMISRHQLNSDLVFLC